MLYLEHNYMDDELPSIAELLQYKSMQLLPTDGWSSLDKYQEARY